MRLALRLATSVALGLVLVAGGAPPAAAAVWKASWHYVADASGVLVGSRYVFVDNAPDRSGQARPGGTLIDEQTGKRTRVVPPAQHGYSCDEASALGAPWLAFQCVLPAPSYQDEKFQVELYRISTGQWRVVPQAVGVRGVGADWIEYWPTQGSLPQPPFVFQNIYSGQSRTLPGWKPGGRVIPDLNSPALGRSLCAPVRVPDAWEPNGEDWPGTVSLFGRYALIAGDNRALRPFAYLERCGTRLHRRIGSIGTPYVSANSHAVVWQPALVASDLHGVYLPSLKPFTVDTAPLINQVETPYTGQNTYSAWLTARTLYVLVNPYYPTDCTPDPCPAPPSQLYATPAPHQAQAPRHHRSTPRP